MGLGKIISKDERNIDTLKDTVKQIFKAIKETEKEVAARYLALLIVYLAKLHLLLRKNSKTAGLI